MPDPVDLSAAAAQRCSLVTVAWGDPAWPNYGAGVDPEGGIVRYAVWAEPITIGADVYQPVESIAAPRVKRDGGARDQPVTMTVPDDAEPARSILGFQSLRKDVTIAECDPSDPVGTVRTIGVWRVAHSSARPGGAVELTLAGAKDDLGASLGVSIQPQCPWELGDRTCGVDLALYTVSVLIDSVSGLRLTSAALASAVVPAGVALADGWARFGRASRGGLVYPIADHAGDTLTLYDFAPAAWAGQTISIVAGCDKTIAACRNPFNNEEFFGGAGIALPQYHPLFNDRPTAVTP